MENTPPANLKDRFWMQATRTDVLVSLGSFIVSTGILASIAQQWTDVTGGKWPASIFLGIATISILMLIGGVSALLFAMAFRRFRPLGPQLPISLPALEEYEGASKMLDLSKEVDQRVGD